MLHRLFPHPGLSLVIVVFWLFLVNDISAGHAALALALGWGIPRFTSPYWPTRPRVRRPLMVLEYLGIFLFDILVSNVQVAYLVLFRRGETLRSQFVTIPLDVRSAEAIVALSGTITLTPGTVTADLSADGRALLVHCLETGDPDATVAQIKQRYERRLKEIFE